MSDSFKYRIRWSSKFKKEYKLAIKRGYNIQLLDDVIKLIAQGNQQQKLMDDYLKTALFCSYGAYRAHPCCPHPSHS